MTRDPDPPGLVEYPDLESSTQVSDSSINTWLNQHNQHNQEQPDEEGLATSTNGWEERSHRWVNEYSGGEFAAFDSSTMIITDDGRHLVVELRSKSRPDAVKPKVFVYDCMCDGYVLVACENNRTWQV